MGFLNMGVPQNGWFIREDPTKMDDLGVPFLVRNQKNGFWVCLKMGYGPNSSEVAKDDTPSNFGVPDFQTNPYFQHLFSLVPTG